MKTWRYALASILLAFGAIALIWGGKELYRALTADEVERIALENALGDGTAPELFALRFVGVGLVSLIVGWFDWRCTARKTNQTGRERPRSS